MKQPCASAAKLRGAGHSVGGITAIAQVGTPSLLSPPKGDRYRQLATRVQPCAETLYLSFSSSVWLINRLEGVNDVDQAADGRSTMPCGISPVVTKRHNPMSNLRASVHSAPRKARERRRQSYKNVSREEFL